MKRVLLIELLKFGMDLFYKDFLDRKYYYLLKKKNYGGSFCYSICSLYDKNKRLVGMMWAKR